jgi:hypothetical protein
MTTPPSGLSGQTGVGGGAQQPQDVPVVRPDQQPSGPAQRPPAGTAEVLKQAAAQPASVPSEPDDAGGLTPDEERQLGELTRKRDEAAAAPGSVRMRVEGEHAEMTFGGITIGREYTTVPPHMAGPLSTAAADAGVKLTQED